MVMADDKRQQSKPRPRSASPAERAEEFAATQRRLKEEAAARRQAAKDSPPKGGKGESSS